MVLLILALEEELVGVYSVLRAVVAQFHFDRFVTGRADKGFAPLVPCDRRAPHISVPGLFFRHDDIAGLSIALVRLVSGVDFGDAGNDGGEGLG